METFVAVGGLVVSVSVPDGESALAQEALSYANTPTPRGGGVDAFLSVETLPAEGVRSGVEPFLRSHTTQHVDGRIRLFDPAGKGLRTIWVAERVPPVAVKLELVQLLQMLLAPRNGLLIHAAGVGMARGACIVIGPSGAGKSTAARLLGGHLLSDDMIVLTALDKTPVAHSTTFGGATDGPHQSPLLAILFPRRAGAFSLRRMTVREAFSCYQLEHGSYLSHSLPHSRRELALSALALFEKVPSLEVLFARDFLDGMAIQEAARTGLPPETGERVDLSQRQQPSARRTTADLSNPE